MNKLELKIAEAENLIKALETELSVVSDMNNLADYGKVEASYQRTMQLIEEIRKDGVSSADISELSSLNMLVGAVESEYTSYRTNFNVNVVALEAEKTGKQKVISGLFSVLVIALSYVLGRLLGALIGGKSSGGSGGGAAGQIEARDIKTFKALTESDAEKLVAAFKSGDTAHWLALNRLITAYDVNVLTGTSVDAIQECMQDLEASFTSFATDDAFNKRFGGKTIEDVYGSAGISEHHKEVVTKCTPALLKAYPDNAELKKLSGSPVNLSKAITSGTLHLENTRDVDIKGTVDVLDFSRSISKAAKDFKKALESIRDDAEDIQKEGSKLAMMSSSEFGKFLDREVVYPANFCNKFLTRVIIPNMSQCVTMFIRLESLYSRLGKSYNSCLKALSKDESERLAKVWEDPENGPVNLKELQRELKAVSNISNVEDCLKKVDAMLAVKLG